MSERLSDERLRGALKSVGDSAQSLERSGNQYSASFYRDYEEGLRELIARRAADKVTAQLAEALRSLMLGIRGSQVLIHEGRLVYEPRIGRAKVDEWDDLLAAYDALHAAPGEEKNHEG